MKIYCKNPVKNSIFEYYNNYNVTSIYSYGTYEGYLEGLPTIEDNEKNINFAIAQANKLFFSSNPFIYTNNINETSILPSRVNIAALNDLENEMCLIWFDDEKMDILESLRSIIDDINWEENSNPYAI